ncbi:MAG TPA: HepT-like ribonuclease domain-containing protein [Longimicrobiales bacterium]|nr:HepT-like ribonuclease domain-containing protein [Longimicrobiales bacterium]
MPRNDRLSLELMLDTARRLHGLARGRSRPDLDTDDVLVLAMLHLIQRLGETASRLSAEFRAAHPEFPWGEMIAMRNRIVHAYGDLDPDIVWHVATDDIEAVIAALERAIAD